MRFLMTSTFYPPYNLGGDAVHVKYLAEELVKKGHEVHVMHSLDAYRIKRGKHLATQPEEDRTGVHLHTLESPLKILNPLTVYMLGTSFYVRKKFLEIVEKIHPDIIHHHNISLLGYDILNKKDARYLSLYTAHDYWLICPTNNLLKNRREFCRKKSCFSCAIRSIRPPQMWRCFRSFKTAIRSIDLIIAPSDYVRRRLAQEIDVKSLPLPNFVPSPPKHNSPAGYTNYFLFVGMLEIHKGILNLLEIFREFGNEINTELLIVGEGNLKNHIKRFIERNSLSKLVYHLGFVDHEKLYSLYRGALAVIIPSIWPENAPLVALEALSVGTPVIASKTGGLPEIVEKVDKKLLFSNWDELKDLLLNFNKNEFSSNKIKGVYEHNFSSKAYIDKYTRIVKNLNFPD